MSARDRRYSQCLETVERTAVRRRSKGLHWAKILLQMPVLAAAGMLLKRIEGFSVGDTFGDLN
jgi:hypothetical protein